MKYTDQDYVKIFKDSLMERIPTPKGRCFVCQKETSDFLMEDPVCDKCFRGWCKKWFKQATLNDLRMLKKDLDRFNRNKLEIKIRKGFVPDFTQSELEFLRHYLNFRHYLDKLWKVKKEIDKVLKVEAYPLMALLREGKKKRKKAYNPRFTWWEDKYGEVWGSINNINGYAATATDLAVDNAARFTKNDLVKVTRTGEIMLVTDVDIDFDTITVTRSVGTGPAAVLIDNDPLLIIGSAKEEQRK